MGDDTIDNVNYEELYKNFLESSDLEDLENELQKPNIFNILGAQRMEIRHSNFLAWLLDPNGSHRLGNRLLIRVLRDLAIDEKNKLNILEINELNFDFVDIVREYPLRNNKKIDILIVIEFEKKDKKLILCIENKIDSFDFQNQLSDYKVQIDEIYQGDNYKKVFVYLTPYGDEPNDGIQKGHWHSYSYKDNIIKHLANIPTKTISSEVKLYINDYLTILNNEIMNKNNSASELANAIYEHHKTIIDFIVDNRDKNVEYQQFWEAEFKWMFESANKIKNLIEEDDINNEYELSFAKSYFSLLRNGKRIYMFFSPTKVEQYSLEFNFLAGENRESILKEIDSLKFNFSKNNKNDPNWNIDATYFVIKNAKELVDKYPETLKEIHKLRFGL